MPQRKRPARIARHCEWINQPDAFKHFASYAGPTQSQQHIRPLHWYAACRLVLEGGFRPEEVTPRPPFTIAPKGGEDILVYDPSIANNKEATVLGGLKTKDVDVVVTKSGLGPVLAISCKGMIGALRNLTNRMEETIGECTNLHITYPALVFGYLFVIRANRQTALAVAQSSPESASPARQLQSNDIAIREGGEPARAILRFHAALKELTSRQGIRNDVSRYEAVALGMVETAASGAGDLLASFPAADSPLRWEQFFKALYLRYDERYVFGAPDLAKITRRLEWSPQSPALKDETRPELLGYEPRLDIA